MANGDNSQASGGNSVRILSSDWGGLNENLIAKFYPIKRMDDGSWSQSKDKRTISEADKYTVDDAVEVWTPLTEGTQEISLNWTSPFEGAGAESKAPVLSAMLQSGMLSENVQALLATPAVQAMSATLGGGVGDGKAKAIQALAAAQGRTGITKLNSTQIFTGMPPLKWSVTMHFRAIWDPISEVREPIAQLEEWALPQYLANDSVLGNALKTGGENGLLATIYPSMSPQLLAMQYSSETYMPVVIESMSRPITGPSDADGNTLTCSVQAVICSLAAWDRRDLRKFYGP